MSRKAKYPIKLPKGVTVTVKDSFVNVKGPKGDLKIEITKPVDIIVDSEAGVSVSTKDHDRFKRFVGLYHSLISNMIIGATEGFTKRLTMIGVGYRAAVKGTKLDLQIGKSHPTELDIPQGITVTVEKNTTIIVTGSDKQELGQFADSIRAKRPPEPYQGKGIRYENEYVRKKAGKAAAGSKK